MKARPEYNDEDMAHVGRSLMERLPAGYSYMDCPTEIVTDLQNEIADLKTIDDATISLALQAFDTGHGDPNDYRRRMRAALEAAISDYPIGGRTDVQIETITSQNARLRAELETERSFVDRVWKALAIVDYAGARGKAIDELVGDLRATLKNIATQKTTDELKAEGEQEYEDADFEGAYDALIHIARRAMQPTT